MGVRPLLQLCDNDYRTHSTCCGLLLHSFYAAWIVEVPHDGSVLSSLVSLSSKSVSLSSSKPLFPHFINLSTYITRHYSTLLAICSIATCLVTKLVWFVHRILSFTLCAHATLQRIQDY